MIPLAAAERERRKITTTIQEYYQCAINGRSLITRTDNNRRADNTPSAIIRLAARKGSTPSVGITERPCGEGKKRGILTVSPPDGKSRSSDKRRHPRSTDRDNEPKTTARNSRARLYLSSAGRRLFLRSLLRERKKKTGEAVNRVQRA